MKKGIIYKYVSKTTGKPYIGQTINPKERKKTHQKAQDNTHFHRAIQKYGFDDFEYSVIETLTSDSRETLDNLLNERECYWIDYYDSFRNGYNMNPGGGHYAHNKNRIVVNNGVNQRMIQEFELSDYKKIGYVEGPLPKSEETRAKISKANKGKLAGDKNPSKRPEVRAKRVEAFKGDKNPMKNPDVAKKQSDSLKQHYIDNPEACDEMSERMKQYYIDNPEACAKRSGDKNPSKRPEVRARMSEKSAYKGKQWYNNGIDEKRYFECEQPEGWVLGRLTGKNNKTYGHHWYNNGTEQMHCFDGEQPEGWVLGRVAGGTSGTKWINKDGKNKCVPVNEIEKYIAGGWVRGYIKKSS